MNTDAQWEQPLKHLSFQEDTAVLKLQIAIFKYFVQL